MFDPPGTFIKGLVSTVANLNAAAVFAGDCVPPSPGPHSAYIPNPVVLTHLGERVRFYDDLIRKKIALLSCMSVRDSASCGKIETLSKVQQFLGEDFGQRLFIYSITTDPEHDTPAVLQAFADKYQAGKGWLFLTGESAALRILRERLFTHSGGQDCSLHLLRYGNEEVGLWGGVAATASPESIVERISWITPRDRPPGPPRRGGPWPVKSEG
jgi:protein SCO1/2